MKHVNRSNRLFTAIVMSAFACEKPAVVRPGSITGTIRTDAAAPAPIALPESVRQVCGAQIPDGSLQVGEGGALANAVVWVEDAPPTPARPTAPLIDQKACAYAPPVLVAHTGGKLKVKNSDPLMHNVRAGELFNVGMPLENQVIERPLPTTAGPVKLVCDVHPWMRADVMVLPHEQWAVTDAQGRFKLEGVAAGRRPVKVWHPLRGERAATVDVPPGGEGKLDTAL
jgi:hypothetical protein